MVRTRGLEPPHRKAPDPKSGVSANFTTSATVKKESVKQKLNKVVRPRGFEPLAYGLEGRCSIQLSYERIRNSALIFKVVRQVGLEPTTYRSEVCRSIQLSYKRSLPI